MGLFEHYPAEPAAILEAADGLLASAGPLDALTESMTSDHRAALEGVDGVLEFPIASAPESTLLSIGNVQLSARYASGCLVGWADGVEAYNSGIEGLNTRWEAIAATLATAAQTNKAEVQLGAIDVDDAEARMDTLLDDKAALLAELRHEQHRLDAVLDGRAADVGGMLDAGPNPDALRYLTASGFLPLPDPADNPAYQHALDLAGADLPDLSVTEVAAWWATLSLVQQRAVMMADPDSLGNLNGLPAAPRDQVNRMLLTTDLAELEALEAAGLLNEQDARALENIRAIQVSLDQVADDSGLPGQLYAYDPWAFNGDGKAAVTVGDIDTADHVAFLVSGLGTSVVSTTIGRAIDVHRASQDRTSDKVAVVNWIGYDAPNGGDVVGVVNRDMAESGADGLADDVAGLLAARHDDPHLTVVGNSYGSTTSAISADEYGLDADDLILTGSPGAGDAETAADLTTGTDHTWIGSASHDLVTSLGSNGDTDLTEQVSIPGMLEGMGDDPADEDFDAQRFTAEHPDRNTGQFDLRFGDLGSSSIGGWNIEDHQRYYDDGTESLDNITTIIVGDYDDVVHAELRYDPLVGVDAGGVDIDAACAGKGPLQLCIPTGVDADRPDVDVMMQDPERDRTPASVHD